MAKPAVKVAVLCQGDSPEREVSLRSGQGVHAALVRRGHHAELLPIDSYDGLPQALAPFPAVFNVLHGGAGEDGTVQLLLDLLGKAYVGSGPLAAAVAMDKAETHRALAAAGLPVPRWRLYTGGELDGFVQEAGAAVGLPAVVKPRREGSSLGLSLAGSKGELRGQLEEAFDQFGDLLVEEFIPGRELTAAVLERDDGLQVLPLVELRPGGSGLFDWTAKYTPGACDFACPARISLAEADRVAEVARAAHQTLGCRDLCRVDVRLTPHGEPCVLEVNTLPGMTEMSTFPRAARAAGLAYEDLVELLLRRALARLPGANPLG
ncbi:MAG: D-alanine--D-alanine ligase family protein [Candidatus Bipolaricaulaceae bacterium]